MWMPRQLQLQLQLLPFQPITAPSAAAVAVVVWQFPDTFSSITYTT